ncbi:hypothetical protein HPB49_019824 [Dermacentor silvarum]|uniref:Uncharacterized protein n=1 Tax=Dermacentor silvarum TaxID=543639 RepID=A0ACB8CZA9_DERSI|nr:hypothetical protein HPB49_019824 [Dermacentor silvarum]
MAEGWGRSAGLESLEKQSTAKPESQVIAVAKSPKKPQRIATMLKWLAFAVTCSILSFQSWLKFTTNLERPRGQPSQFAIDFESDSFTLDGEPVRILSGSVHYFRTPRELWMERLIYARAAGLNTIDTFVEWSSHEPEEGHFDFHGQRDLVAFLEMAHNLSFMVILRPGPYIGAERDMGGLPYWLLRTDPSIRLRTMDTRYIKFADRYLTELFKRIKHLFVRNGGPIIMVQSTVTPASHVISLWQRLVIRASPQVENKYGLSRECNRTYLRHLRDLMRQELGGDTVLFTTDRVGVGTMSCGRVEGVYPAVAFGAMADVSDAFATLRLYQKRGPLFVSELYTGWFDRWAMPHQHMDPAMVASMLRQVLLAGASVNLLAQLFVLSPKMFGLAGLQYLSRGHSVSSQYPLTFEQVGHAHGLMFYNATITYQPHVPAMLSVEGIRDGGHVYLNGVFVDSISRAENNNALLIKAKLHQELTILVHNEGRISSGKDLSDSKGIVSNVTLDKRLLTNWTMRPVPLTNANWLTDYAQMRSIREQTSLRAASSAFEVRVFAAKFELPASDAYDVFLRPDQKTKGIAFLNGFNLGRYWPARGPQKTLYVPRTLFRKENLLVLIELEGGFYRGDKPPVIHFVDEPELHGTVHRMDE